MITTPIVPWSTPESHVGTMSLDPSRARPLSTPPVDHDLSGTPHSPGENWFIRPLGRPRRESALRFAVAASRAAWGWAPQAGPPPGATCR